MAERAGVPINMIEVPCRQGKSGAPHSLEYADSPGKVVQVNQGEPEWLVKPTVRK
jgi:hypothetical protein